MMNLFPIMQIAERDGHIDALEGTKNLLSTSLTKQEQESLHLLRQVRLSPQSSLLYCSLFYLRPRPRLRLRPHFPLSICPRPPN